MLFQIPRVSQPSREGFSVSRLSPAPSPLNPCLPLVVHISVRASAPRLAHRRAFAPSALMAISYSETMRAFGALPSPESTSESEYMLKPWDHRHKTRTVHRKCDAKHVPLRRKGFWKRAAGHKARIVRRKCDAKRVPLRRTCFWKSVAGHKT